MTNHDDELQQVSVSSLFEQFQETLDDAKKKSASESNVKTQYFQLAKDGTYSLRIMPLAPVIGADGQVVAGTRKGYEYPHKDLFLKIEGTDKKGNKATRFVPVCHTKLAYPELENDLIDLYVKLACEAYEDDKEFYTKITSSSFNGGLKYNAKRCMYVLDMEDRNKGLQILQLSFAQYKDLEEAKLRLWNKLAQKNHKVLCPISSPFGAYPVEITRKTEKKTSYAISIDTISGLDSLSETELQALIDAPRLPDVLYVYRRFHLEATIEFLRQMDDKYGLKLMSTPEILECIEQIKMRLPADDQSHFSFNSDDNNGGSDSKDGKTTLDSLWAMYDELEEKGLGDRTEEGQNLRSLIREFIEENDLDVRVDRKKTNLMVLEELQDLMEGEKGEPEEDLDDAPEEDDYTPEPESEPEEAEDEDDEDEPEDPRNERNDDTNEPAARSPRRTTRPARRR